MKRIALVGFTGWAGIVWLGWHLADARLGGLCHWMEQYCKPALVAQRDAVLTNGLTVALVGLLALMLVTRQPDQRGRLSRLRPTLPDMFDFVRSRRWLIGVAAAAALSAIIWFTARPAQWLVAENAPGGAVAVVASDDVTAPADAYVISAPGANPAAADAPAYDDAVAAATDDSPPAENQPALTSDDITDAGSSVAD